MNESMIEIRKSQEGLYILNFPGFRPILDYFDFIKRHRQSR